MRMLSWVIGGMVGALLILGPGCRQKSNEPCSTTTDCDESKDLICCIDGSSASSVLGICLTQEECTPLAPDAAVPDAAIEPDAATQADAAVPDAATGPDAATQADAAVPDAATEPDAATQADAAPTVDASV